MTRAEILEKANACVTGERQEDYGVPENSFGTIASFWTVYLNSFMENKVYLSGEDVALMMALLKIARAISSQNLDNYIDLAGYAACAGELAYIDLAGYAACAGELAGRAGNEL